MYYIHIIYYIIYIYRYIYTVLIKIFGPDDEFGDREFGNCHDEWGSQNSGTNRVPTNMWWGGASDQASRPIFWVSLAKIARYARFIPNWVTRFRDRAGPILNQSQNWRRVIKNWSQSHVVTTSLRKKKSGPIWKKTKFFYYYRKFIFRV